jgi:NADH dehydrogenase FAD-containing subunit
VRLVLVGAAHAHLLVVEHLAAAPLADVEVHWVTRGKYAAYSGMLSGWLAGEYSRESCRVDLAALARAAGVVLHTEGCVGLDAGRSAVWLEGGPPLTAEVLSLGLGSVLVGAELPGVHARAFHAKALLEEWERFSAAWGPWVIVGAGLGGIELALCLRSAEEVTLLADGERFPTGASGGLVKAVRQALEERGVQVVYGRALALTEEAVSLADGRSVPARSVLWATGPAPHPLLSTSGLALGATGAVSVDGSLRSTSHSNVFAAGDCADLSEPVQKSGVYSVRETPVLLHNLVAALRGQPLQVYRPQRRALALVNCGDGTALLSWGKLAARAGWVHALKHRLDSRFMEKLRRA